MNWFLLLSVLFVMLEFRESSRLAAAYGLAVTGTMIITTALFYRVTRDRWNWSVPVAGVVCGLFLFVDLAFFGANIIKFADGGWFPIVEAAAVYTLMTTWKRGRAKLTALVQQSSLPIDLFLADVAKRPPLRVPGTAIVLTSAMDIAPPVLLHSLKHNKVLHQRVVWPMSRSSSRSCSRPASRSTRPVPATCCAAWPH